MMYHFITKMRLVILIVSVMVVAVVAAQPSTENVSRCDSLLLVRIDYEVLKSRSPFTAFRSTYEINNCTTIIYTPPECGKPPTTGIAICIRPHCMYSYTLQEIDDSTQWLSTLTAINVTLNVRNVYANFNGTSAAFCLVECAADGISYEGVMCLGKTQKDEADILQFVDTKLKGVPNIKSMTEGCPSK